MKWIGMAVTVGTAVMTTQDGLAQFNLDSEPIGTEINVIEVDPDETGPGSTDEIFEDDVTIWLDGKEIGTTVDLGLDENVQFVTMFELVRRDFNDGTLGEWDEIGPNWRVVSNAARVDGNTNGPSPLRLGVDTTGFESIQVGFNWRIVENMEEGDFVTFDWRPDSTSSWTELARFTGAASAEWSTKTFALDEIANNNPDLEVRVAATLGSGADEFGLENFWITATPIPEPITLLTLGLGSWAVLRRKNLV